LGTIAPNPQVSDGFHIRTARSDDLPALPPIEREAAKAFAGLGLIDHLLERTLSLDELAEHQAAGRIWVAADSQDRPVGFAVVSLLDGAAHLEELDVHPSAGKRGLGRRLVDTVCEWAGTQGLPAVTLSTFRDLPWNAPFYARAGFRVLDGHELGPALRRMRTREDHLGVPIDRRVVMRRDVGPGPAARAPVFLTARWEHLAMLNWVVDPSVLRPRVPAGTELDDFAGETWVSMVGFRFLDTRVLGVGIPFHRDFSEVNLRFYVRRTMGSEVRRGVCFVKEIVPRRAIAAVARALYGERYVALPMRHELSPERVAYDWRFRGRWHRIGLRPVGTPAPVVPGSAEAFITEHYWGYAAQRRGGTVEYRVEHPPWRVWQADEATFTCDVGRLYGPEFAVALSAPPRSAFLAEGSAVEVRRGVPILGRQ
jgi:uncharacterized protein